MLFQISSNVIWWQQTKVVWYIYYRFALLNRKHMLWNEQFKILNDINFRQCEERILFLCDASLNCTVAHIHSILCISTLHSDIINSSYAKSPLGIFFKTNTAYLKTYCSCWFGERLSVWPNIFRKRNICTSSTMFGVGNVLFSKRTFLGFSGNTTL